MSDLATALLKEGAEEGVLSAYQRMQEIVQRVRPFVKARRLVRMPRPGTRLPEPPARVNRKH
jgi:hypothetical protein